MKKIAFFVEGYTEVVFLEKLIKEIAGAHNVIVRTVEIRGGAKAPISYAAMNAVRAATQEQFYALIFDCGGDTQVATRIKNEHQNLTDSGYSMIIGIRDVFPDFGKAEIPDLETGLKAHLDPALIPVEYVLGVMEVESWFLGEVNHFPLVDAAITVQAVNLKLGIDISIDDLSLRPHPADDMHQAYQIAGRAYAKGQHEITTSRLDYAHIYLTMKNRFTHLDLLVQKIDAFLT